jgi:hypothetical protein
MPDQRYLAQLQAAKQFADRANARSIERHRGPDGELRATGGHRGNPDRMSGRQIELEHARLRGKAIGVAPDEAAGLGVPVYDVSSIIRRFCAGRPRQEWQSTLLANAGTIRREYGEDLSGQPVSTEAVGAGELAGLVSILNGEKS